MRTMNDVHKLIDNVRKLNDDPAVNEQTVIAALLDVLDPQTESVETSAQPPPTPQPESASQAKSPEPADAPPGP